MVVLDCRTLLDNFASIVNKYYIIQFVSSGANPLVNCSSLLHSCSGTFSYPRWSLV